MKIFAQKVREKCAKSAQKVREKCAKSPRKVRKKSAKSAQNIREKSAKTFAKMFANRLKDMLIQGIIDSQNIRV
jgi:flagellar motor switch protein FliM